MSTAQGIFQHHPAFGVKQVEHGGGIVFALSLYATAVMVSLSLAMKRLFPALRESFLTEKFSLDKELANRLYAFRRKIVSDGDFMSELDTITETSW